MDMKLIIGLGNPGPEYRMTRHNAGFLALDFLQNAWAFGPWKKEGRFSAEVSDGTQGTTRVLLVRPETFMNESGLTVRRLLDFYKLTSGNLAVIHDDLDLEPGTLRTTASSRSAGHNGVQDIIERIGTQDFFRIRLGIGRPAETLGACLPSHDYVLQRFSPEEQECLAALFPRVQEAAEEWLGSDC